MSELLQMVVLPEVLPETLMGPQSDWLPQRVLDMVAEGVPEEVPGWVLSEGTVVLLPEKVPELLSGATRCNPGAMLEYPPQGIHPSHNLSHRKCLVAIRMIFKSLRSEFQ